MDLDKEMCRLLIKLYRTKEFLWDIKSTNYYNKALRQEAWEEISSIIGAPVPDLKRKLTILSASYRREKSRIAKSVSQGKKPYVSRWFAFKDFHYIYDKQHLAKASEIVPDNISSTVVSGSAEIYDSHQTTRTKNETLHGNLMETETIPESSTNGTKRILISKHKLSKIKNHQLRKKADKVSAHQCTTFGHHIDNELRKYDPHTLAHVKQAINNVIFEADLKKFCNSAPFDQSSNQKQQEYSDVQRLKENGLVEYQNLLQVKEESIDCTEPTVYEANEKTESTQNEESEKSEFDLWAKNIANTMNRMDLRRSLRLQLKIQTIMTEERLEQLERLDP